MASTHSRSGSPLPRCISLALAVLCLAAPATAGAGECSLEAGDHSFAMMLEGVERTYDVGVPPGCDPDTPMPIVFDFHGLTSTKDEQRFFSGFRAKADAEGFVIVHPQGYGGAWNSGWCCSRFANPQHFLDDVAFVRTILDIVAESLPIDRSRVYATGLSNGGAMSHHLACNASEWITAALPVSFHLSTRDACQPVRAIPILQFHGILDNTVPYINEDNPFSPWPNAPDGIARWGEINGCDAEPTRTVDLPGVFCDEHQSCDDGATAGLCSVVEGGHLPYAKVAQAGLNLTDSGWAFLSSHVLPVPEPGAAAARLTMLAVLCGVARRRSTR